jgi:hypothetical protein
LFAEVGVRSGAWLALLFFCSNKRPNLRKHPPFFFHVVLDTFDHHCHPGDSIGVEDLLFDGRMNRQLDPDQRENAADQAVDKGQCRKLGTLAAALWPLKLKAGVSDPSCAMISAWKAGGPDAVDSLFHSWMDIIDLPRTLGLCVSADASPGGSKIWLGFITMGNGY